MLKKAKIYSNKSAKSLEIVDLLMKKLVEKSFDIVEENEELAIAVGGDGTFLKMLKKSNFDSNICYVGINTGTLGFLQEIKPDEIDEFINKIINEEYKIDKINVQTTLIKTLVDEIKYYSLNEILVRDKDLNIVSFNVKINGDLLEKYVGDCIIISTSTGSTAHNLSLGGSIVYNSLKTMQITPIAPLNSNAYNGLRCSVILSEDTKIELSMTKGKNNLIVGIDGENTIIDNVESITTYINEKTINYLRIGEYNFTKIINDKLIK